MKIWNFQNLEIPERSCGGQRAEPKSAFFSLSLPLTPKYPQYPVGTQDWQLARSMGKEGPEIGRFRPEPGATQVGAQNPDSGDPVLGAGCSDRGIIDKLLKIRNT